MFPARLDRRRSPSWLKRDLSPAWRVDALPREGQAVTIEAAPAEREALASFYHLPAIAALTATLRLEPWGRGGARVTGVVHGELTQICIVSLEPFPATVDEAVDVRFAPRQPPIPGPRRKGSADVFARRRRRARSRHRRKNRPRRSRSRVLRARPRSLSAQARRDLRTRSARNPSRRIRRFRRWPSGTNRGPIRARMLRADGRLAALHKI